MTVHGYIDWLKRCKKRQALFKFCFPMCLERTRVHMPTKKTDEKHKTNLFMGFQAGVFKMNMVSRKLNHF